jgi:hypothetical protein
MRNQRPLRYKDAGVNIDEADRAVSLIKQSARKTFTPRVLTDIGSFGAGYRLAGYKRPVLISSADGVGTKLKVAFLANKHDTIGQCLVNHCVNDIAVQGAAPLFFLDYFAVGKLEAAVAGQVATGLAKACSENGCSLIGGETAEMPGLYPPASMTSPDSSSAASSAPRCSPARKSPPAICCSACPPPDSTPTAIPSPASSSSRWPATRSTPTSPNSTPPPPRNCSKSTAAT